MSKGYRKKYWKALTNVFIYIVAVVLLVTVFPKLLLFFMPFVIGWIISLIANPAVRFFEEKLKIKRKAVSAVVIILVIALILLAGYAIGSFLITQGAGLVKSIPEKWPEIEKSLDGFGEKFSELTKKLPEKTRDSFSDFGKNVENYLGTFVSKLGTPTWAALSKFAKSLPSTIIAVIMALLSSYVLTVEHNSLKVGVEKHAPKFIYSRLQTVGRGIKRAVGGYIVAQVKIELWIYLIMVIGLVILRVDYAIVIALGIAFLDFLPFFGSGIIMVPWAIIAFFNADYFTAIGMLITWGVGQLVRQIIQPKYVGDSIGMKPLPTLLLLYIGFELKGVLGMIIAVPIGIIVYSLYEEGLFDTFIDSLKILWNGINHFRKLRSEDLIGVREVNGPEPEKKEEPAEISKSEEE